MRGIQLTSLKIAERDFLEGPQKRGIIMLGEYELSIFINKGGNSAGILPYLPEVRIVQSQQGTY